MKAVLLGIMASFFFAVTFVLNQSMSMSGGSWIWSASLRYIFMLPLLLTIVFVRRNADSLASVMLQHPWKWLWWSFVGFGCFYAPLCFAASFSPAWLVAGTWQLTILCGSLLAPLFYETVPSKNGVQRVQRRIPYQSMVMSVVIVIGALVMEWSHATHVSFHDVVFGTIPIIVATFAYPLGNRKMMEVCDGKLDAYQRTLGMTIASLPLWLILSVGRWTFEGPPSASQVLQSAIVALFSGVIATVLFFSATDLAKDHMHQLAAVEATQSGEAVFTLAGEFAIIPDTSISVAELSGLIIVVIGMIAHSLYSSRIMRTHSGTTVNPTNRTTSASEAYHHHVDPFDN